MTIRRNNEGTKFSLDFKHKGYPRFRRVFPSHGEALIMEANLKAMISEGKPAEVVKAFFDAQGFHKESRANGTQDASVYEVTWEQLRKLGHLHYDGSKNWKDATKQTDEWVDYLKDKTPLSLLKESHVDSFIEQEKARGLNPKTINRKLSTLRVILKKGKRKGLLESPPLIENLKESKGRVVYYSDKMLEDFFSTLSRTSYADMAPVYWFLLDTGCRTGELEKFTVNDGESVTFRDTKSDKPRTVPLTQRLRDYLGEQEAATPFPMMTESRLRKSFEAVREKLGWTNEYVKHTFRHTCATKLVKGGVHITDVKEWLGHSNINTTMIYVQFSPEHLKNAVKALES